MSEELKRAYDVANATLERPNADPDDDQAVLARQLTRLMDRTAMVLSHLRVISPLCQSPHSEALRLELSAVIDPEGFKEGRYG